MFKQIKNNIYSIYVKLPDNPLRNINAYVIKDPDRNLLIDTGFNQPVCLECLQTGLRELDIDMNKTDIYLTHHHSDHSGLVNEIATENTQVFMSRIDAEYLVFMYSQQGRDSMYQTNIEAGFTQEQAEHARSSVLWDYGTGELRNLHHVYEGDKLHYGGHELEVIFTPGHTPGHSCLYDSADKLMFLGDHVLFDITPNITAWPGFENALGNYIDSLVKISSYDVEIPLPAHREVTCGMQERINAIIEHHGVRVHEVVDVLDKYPGISANQIAGHMSWNIRASNNRWEDFPGEQKGFAVSETVAHLEYLLERGRIRRICRDNVFYYYNVDNAIEL